MLCFGERLPAFPPAACGSPSPTRKAGSPHQRRSHGGTLSHVPAAPTPSASQGPSFSTWNVRARVLACAGGLVSGVDQEPLEMTLLPRVSLSTCRPREGHETSPHWHRDKVEAGRSLHREACRPLTCSWGSPFPPDPWLVSPRAEGGQGDLQATCPVSAHVVLSVRRMWHWKCVGCRGQRNSCEEMPWEGTPISQCI